MKIPGDSVKFGREYLNPDRAIIQFMLSEAPFWPSVEYFDIMALAQHHGLPTRLLDWSRSAHIAAYFAASGSLFESCEHKAERLAVWALDIKFRLLSLEIIIVPGGNNANVAAQGGLFTILKQQVRIRHPFEGDHSLDGHMRILDSRSYGRRSRGSQAMAKVTLPITEAPKVIDLCKRQGITAATLQPDFYGAAKTALEYLKCCAMSERTDGRDIQVETLPATLFRLPPLPPFSFQPLRQKNFEQRLVKLIALIGEDHQVFDHSQRQQHGDSSERRLQSVSRATR